MARHLRADDRIEGASLLLVEVGSERDHHVGRGEEEERRDAVALAEEDPGSRHPRRKDAPRRPRPRSATRAV
ncbi:MAG TPA: hypothetical protein VKE69_00555 [Planctomycetota bacterium]|nr:hypothetical protein [Planctomycetota bacterium]